MRSKGLDVLRGIAVILVLFRHSTLSDSNPLVHFGWLGVDLFFVLSGYLISNLLFTEYKSSGKVDISRFLKRRALKIFPPFYIYLAISLITYWLLDSTTFTNTQYISELFYLQSYIPGIWIHTWSLAVEEHFYIVFALTIFILSNKRIIKNKKLMMSSLLSLLLLVFFMRTFVSLPHQHEDQFSFTQSHLRCDGIIVGIIVAYFLNFFNQAQSLTQKRWLLLLLSLILITPGFLFNGGSFLMNTFGLTAVNLGFGLLVLLTVSVFNNFKNLPPIVTHFLSGLAFIGLCSYSIYLWHQNAEELTSRLIDWGPIPNSIIYIILSILTGYIFWLLIEKPITSIKNKLVP